MEEWKDVKGTYGNMQVSNKDNALHAMNNGLWENNLKASQKVNESRRKKVIAYKDGEEMHFNSISEAERHFNSRHICDVLNNKRDHVKGWSFCYERQVM